MTINAVIDVAVIVDAAAAAVDAVVVVVIAIAEGVISIAAVNERLSGLPTRAARRGCSLRFSLLHRVQVAHHHTARGHGRRRQRASRASHVGGRCKRFPANRQACVSVEGHKTGELRGQLYVPAGGLRIA